MDENSQSQSIQVNQTQVKSALTSALEYCKLGKFEYILTQNDLPSIQKHFEQALRKQVSNQTQHFDITVQLVSDFAQAMAQDSFSECFKSPRRLSYNTTPMLYLFYLIGLLIRWFILLPLRALIFFSSIIFGVLLIVGVQLVIPFECVFRKRILLFIFKCVCKCVCFTFSTVLRLHSLPKKFKAGRIYVCNHTTVLDFALLNSIAPFSVIGQKQPGLLGFCQKYICSAIGPVWFDRMDRKDRQKTAQLLKNRVFDPDQLCPVLVFPEGCCVNNRFTVQFKKGAFELGAEVCPVAIKYSEVSSAAYQNSKKMKFFRYLVSLWTQWMLVAEVWFLPPVEQKTGQTADEFAHQVQLEISQAAKLIPRQWDGYLKYIHVNQKTKDQQKSVYARQLGLSEKVKVVEESVTDEKEKGEKEREWWAGRVKVE